VLGAAIALMPQPSGKGFGGHLPAATVEQYGHDRGAALLAVNPGEESVFVAEGFGRAPSEHRAAFEVHRGNFLEWVFRIESRADMGKGALHGQEDTLTDEPAAVSGWNLPKRNKTRFWKGLGTFSNFSYLTRFGGRPGRE
jgi:hypothetical protein